VPTRPAVGAPPPGEYGTGSSVGRTHSSNNDYTRDL